MTVPSATAAVRRIGHRVEGNAGSRTRVAAPDSEWMIAVRIYGYSGTPLTRGFHRA